MSTTPPDDDDAFRWEGDEDERAIRTRRRRGTKAGPAVPTDPADEGPETEGPATEQPALELPDELAQLEDGPGADDDGPAASSFGIIVLGIFGGIGLLETVGWIRADFRLPFTTDVSAGLTATSALPYVIEILDRIAAVIAAPLWFGVVLWRIPPGARRALWLVIGALLLLPWPVLVSAS